MVGDEKMEKNDSRVLDEESSDMFESLEAVKTAVGDDESATTRTSICSDVSLAERKILQESLNYDEDHDGVPKKEEEEEDWYGHPLSPQEAVELIPSSSRGLVWYATVVPDDFLDKEGKPMKGLNPRDFHNDSIKPRRGSLPLLARELFQSLTQTPDGRYIFNGKLNGWPALRTLELVALERKRILPLNQFQFLPHWKIGESVGPPTCQDDAIYRATLRGADWSSFGYSRDSPGFVSWFESQPTEGPRLFFGTDMVKHLSFEQKCSMVHMVSHRYAVSRVESPKDRITYHSVVLLEWEHGLYTTVVEGAYLNGIGGYKCRSNWYADKDQEGNLLSQSFPEDMVAPWITTATEIRCYDVPQRNVAEFQEYLETYKGHQGRFVDPQITFSHKARLTYRSKGHIAQYLLNYIGRDCTYQELNRNCQTLAADICAFLAGKKMVAPFHPIVKMEYRNRKHFFLYESDMYN